MFAFFDELIVMNGSAFFPTNSSTSLQHLEAACTPSTELISPSRNPISRWSVSTASCRWCRPQGSGEAGGDLGLGATIAIIDMGFVRWTL